MMSAAIVSEEENHSPQFGWSRKLYHVGWLVYHHAAKHAGVGIICSVAYFDPGNWSVDLQAGSQYGYTLLFTILLAGIFCTFLQVLASRLGIVTGLDFASHCRLLFHDRPRHKLLWRWGVFYPLYALAEIAIICTDLAEMLGSAIAFVLLFPALPLWSTVLLTATDVMFILAFENPLKHKPVRLFEGIIAVLVFAVLILMVIIISKISVDWATAFRGFVPSKGLFSSGSIYTSVGIVGATVMPHTLFLGSHLATQDRLAELMGDLPKFSQDPNDVHQMTLLQFTLGSLRRIFNWRRLFYISRSNETFYPPNVFTHADRENNDLDFVRSHIYHSMADMIGSLMGFAVVINSSILVLSSAVFYYNSGAYGSESPASLFDAYSLIKDGIGNGAALLFAVALLASGQCSSLVATVAGQSVSEGFLHWRVSPTMRRLITRGIGLVPSVIIASVVGESGINTLLVASQVILSIVLPFIIFPLIWLTSSSRVMSVKSRTTSTSPFPTEIPPGSSSLPETSADKEANSGQVVDFSSGRIVTTIGYIVCFIILAANLYVLATL